MAGLIDLSLMVLEGIKNHPKSDDPWSIGRGVGGFFAVLGGLGSVALLSDGHQSWRERLIGFVLMALIGYVGKRLYDQKKWAVIAAYFVSVVVGIVFTSLAVGMFTTLFPTESIVRTAFLGAVFILIAWLVLIFDFLMLFTCLIYYPQHWSKLGYMPKS